MKLARTLAGIALALAAGSSRAADVDAHIPANTEVVVSVNIEQLLASPLGKRYLKTTIEEALKGNAQGQDALKFLELDPTRDITRVTIALASAAADSGFIIVRGKFNRAKIAALAEKVAADQKDKLKIHQSSTDTVYEIAGDKTMFATFPSDTTLLLATDRDQLAKSAKGDKPKKELVALIEKADATQAAWLAALAGVASAVPADEAQKVALEKLDGIVGVLRVDQNAKLDLTLISRDAASAAATAKMIGDLIGAAKVFGPQAVKDKPELAPLLEVINTIRAAAKGKTVAVTAEASGTLIEKAVKQFGNEK